MEDCLIVNNEQKIDWQALLCIPRGNLGIQMFMELPIFVQERTTKQKTNTQTNESAIYF